jgi:hypothetical protein
MKSAILYTASAFAFYSVRPTIHPCRLLTVIGRGTKHPSKCFISHQERVNIVLCLSCSFLFPIDLFHVPSRESEYCALFIVQFFVPYRFFLRPIKRE